jgi:hypothetical protein
MGNSSMLTLSVGGLPSPRHATQFSTESFLYGLGSGDREVEKSVVDRLCKKIEVPKRLVVEYSKDLDRTINPDPVKPEYLKFFLLLLLKLASEDNDYKYLNCALKIVDGNVQGGENLSLTIVEKEYVDEVFDQMISSLRLK